MKETRSAFYLIGILLLVFGISSCEDFLGEKTDTDFIKVPEQSFREVSYVPVQPILDQFVRPTDVIAGFDELIYVVDAGTQEVIALDESGRELGRKFIQGAKAIAQDRSLQLLVIGTFTETANGNPVDRSCIYRLNLQSILGYGIQHAVIINRIIHPFYFRVSAISKDTAVVFNRITVLNDNSYYVTRVGPVNIITQAGGPDNNVLLFDASDNFITPVAISDNRGAQFLDFYVNPFAISSLVKPPQISADARGDFIVSMLDPDGALKVQYIQRIESPEGISYVPRSDWENNPDLADNFINEFFKFEEPVGIEFAGDGTNYIFVVDAQKDSLYQFTSTGIEGVEPPPASGETRFVRTSFGGSGIGPKQFNRPMSVAYKDRIVYVADAGNGRVLRFILTLDIR